MLKVTILCLLFAVLFAQSPTWVGEWDVFSQKSTNLSVCSVPLLSTLVNISVLPSGGLNMTGYNVHDKKVESWTLEWNADDQNPSFCDGNLCAAGYFIWEKKIKYANIAWNVTNPGSVQFCSIVIVPSNASWTGLWAVAFADSTNLQTCDVPKVGSLTNITVQDDSTLQMTGIDQLSGGNTTWILNWLFNQLQVTGACTTASCASASISTLSGVMQAVINWTVTGSSDTCRVVMGRIQSEEVVDQNENGNLEILSSAEEEHLPDPFVIASEPFRSAERWISIDSGNHAGQRFLDFY